MNKVKENIFYVTNENGDITKSYDMDNFDDFEEITKLKKKGVKITQKNKNEIIVLFGEIAVKLQRKYSEWVTGKKRKIAYSDFKKSNINLVVRKDKNFIEIYVEDSKNGFQDKIISFLENYSKGYKHEIIFGTGVKHGILGEITSINTVKEGGFVVQTAETSLEDVTGVRIADVDLDQINEMDSDKVVNLVKTRLSLIITVIKHNVEKLKKSTNETKKSSLKGILN